MLYKNVCIIGQHHKYVFYNITVFIVSSIYFETLKLYVITHNGVLRILDDILTQKNFKTPLVESLQVFFFYKKQGISFRRLIGTRINWTLFFVCQVSKSVIIQLDLYMSRLIASGFKIGTSSLCLLHGISSLPSPLQDVESYDCLLVTKTLLGILCTAFNSQSGRVR